MHDRILYKDHGEAKRREEELSTDEVRADLEDGLILRRHPEDDPFPSYLVLGWIGPSWDLREGPTDTYRGGGR
jgi:hypothetical protein